MVEVRKVVGGQQFTPPITFHPACDSTVEDNAAKLLEVAAHAVVQSFGKMHDLKIVYEVDITDAGKSDEEVLAREVRLLTYHARGLLWSCRHAAKEIVELTSPFCC